MSQIRSGEVLVALEVALAMAVGVGLIVMAVAIRRLRASRAALARANLATQTVEQRFQQLAERVDEIFWIASPGLTAFEYLSPAFERIRGVSPQTVYRRAEAYFDAVDAGDLPLVRSSAAAPAVRHDITYRIHRPDGSVRWLRDRAFPVMAASGEVERVIGVASDISDSVAARLLAERRARHREALAEFARILLQGAESPAGRNAAISSALEVLREAVDADQAFLYEGERLGNGLMANHLTVDVARSGGPRLRDNPDMVTLTSDLAAPDTFVRFTAGEAIAGPVEEVLSGAPELLRRVRHRSVLTVPLHLGVAWSGSLGCTAVEAPRRWDDGEIQLWRTAAEILGNFLHRVQAEADLEARIGERTGELAAAIERLETGTALLEGLHQTSLSVVNMLDPVEVLKAVAGRAAALVGADRAFVYLVDPGSETMSLRFGVGFDAPVPREVLRRGEGVSGRVWQSGEPILVDDYSRWPGQTRGGPAPEPLRAVAAVPLTAHDVVVGVLGVVAVRDETDFDHRTTEVLDRFGRLASIALENARLYRGLEEQLTERSRIERQLRMSESRLRDIIDGVPHFIYAKDAEGRFVLANQSAIRSFGVDSTELIGRSDREFRDQFDDFEAARAVDREVLETGQPRIVPEMGFTDATGARLVLQVAKLPLALTDGPAAVLIVGTDITRRKLDEDEIRRLNQELESRVRRRTAELEVANRELESFSYSVSHDLRTPLRAIEGFSQALVDDYRQVLDEQAQHYLQRIAAATLRMGHLIDDLLRLSRVTRAEFNLAPVDLSALADQVVADLRQAEPGRAVRVVVAPGLRAIGDPGLLRIMLGNLLANAWKFTGREADPVIELGVGRDGERAFFVRDNGAGFDMRYAGKLFGAFQRLHHPDEFPGTGIGLATVHRVVSRHGGRVWADSTPGEGATFFFTLPDS